MNHSAKTKQVSYRWAIIVLVFTILIVLFDISPFGGSGRFYSKWIECGRKPVEITSAPGAGFAWYEESQSFSPVRFGYLTYFCTPEEAGAAGYASSRNGY